MIVENEQPGNKQSFYHLEIGCRLVGEKFGNPAIGSWTNRDYIKLSSTLSRETDVQISPSTLKRIFGKLKTPERYFPQKATRDALARFSHFKDWESLVAAYPRPVVLEKTGIPKVEERGVSVIELKPIPQKRRWKWFLVLALIPIVLFTWKLIDPQSPVPVKLDGISLTCSNPEGENPHSANFRIDLPKTFNGDLSKFRIDFGDGRVEKSIVPMQLVSHYYEVPGRHYAVLKYDAQPLDTVALYLKTNGWTATASMMHDTTRVYPIEADWLFKKEDLHVSTIDLLRSGVDTNRTFFVSFVNSKPLQINGDNFELEADVVTSGLRPGVRCSQVAIAAFGEKSFHSVMLIKPGCVSWAHLRFSEVQKDGEREDLGALGTDLTGGGKIKLRVVGQTVSLSINGKPAYSSSYSVPLQKLYGVRITFSGIGSVNDLVLKDLTTGKIFDEGFGHSIGRK